MTKVGFFENAYSSETAVWIQPNWGRGACLPMRPYALRAASTAALHLQRSHKAVRSAKPVDDKLLSCDKTYL